MTTRPSAVISVIPFTLVCRLLLLLQRLKRARGLIFLVHSGSHALERFL